jgi:hypothetical protein
VTITSALPRLLRSKFLLAGALFAFASGSAANAATSAPPQSRATDPALLLSSTPLKQIVPLFPATGLIAAAWATHHVRRRNARRLAAIK